MIVAWLTRFEAWPRVFHKKGAKFSGIGHSALFQFGGFQRNCLYVIHQHLDIWLIHTGCSKEANRGRVTPSTEFTCYHVAYLIGLSHLCALLVYQCLIVPTNENVQMKQASAATFQNLELARNCYRSLHLQFVFNLILLKVIVILQYLLVINLI